MTRAEQNTIIINSITDRLKDLPNVQQIISSKFDAWFRELVKQGQQLLMEGQASQAPAAPEQGAPAPEAG